ncbi:MAG TPA: hypothetical protein DDY13_07265 [Cytophagales bacterium]|jgi:predicted transcriptional regulator|nr:hypothetical protein [Cytophagales bacterium]
MERAAGNLNDLKRVYNSFFEKPKTMKEVDKEINVMRESVCWYCRTLRLNDKIFAVGKRRCNITGYYVTEWSTNPEFKPQSSQLTFEF